MPKNFKSLTRQQVKNVIDGKGNTPRVPVLLHFWTTPSVFGKKEYAVREIYDAYPQDVERIEISTPDVFNAPENSPNYRWLYYNESCVAEPEERSKALDLQINIPDEVFEEEIDDIISKFPSPYDKAAFPYEIPEKATDTVFSNGGTASLSATGHCEAWKTH